MPTIKEIQDGKTCDGCNAGCKNFVLEADCCLYQTFMSALYSEVVGGDENEEVHYEPIDVKTRI